MTRQVAAHDNTVAVGSGTRLTDYYTQSGEPPGQWMGKGCEALGVSGIVREDQMASLFGEGLHPDADRRPGMDNQLGRRAPVYKGNSEFRKDCDTAIESFRETHGRGVTLDERAAIRTAVATRLLAVQHPGVTFAPSEVRDFIGAAMSGDRQAVAGFDLVFSPVKSISTLWAVGTAEQRAQVEAAHHDAVREVVEHLEREVAFTRTGAGGVAQIETRGLVATAFDHRTSRAGDPDFHTHLAVANRVQGVDGKWRTLDGRVLHSAKISASEMYNTRVEANISARLGVRFAGKPRTDGKREVREIVGVPDALNAAFSRRREAIVARHTALMSEYRDKHGRSPSKAMQVELAQQATLETREAKGLHRPLSERVAQWRAVSERVLGAGGFEDAMSAAAAVDIEVDRRSPEQIASDALAVLSSKHSTFTRWHVRAEIERQVRGYPTSDLTALVDQVQGLVVGGGGAIRLTVDGPAVTPEQQRSNGESIYRVHGQDRYTVQSVLDAEQRLITACRELTAHQAQVPGDLVVDLDAGQRELVNRFVSSGLLLVPAVGAAGVGKTTAMRAVVQAWQLNGGRVVAMAYAASAAKTLGDEVGIRAQTIAKVITLHRAGLLTDEHVAAGDMLLVDEAGSAGTLDLDALRGIAVERGAVIRLVGDWRQSGAPAAGGALRLLSNELGATEMLEVHRFTDQAEAAASLALRAGETESVEFYLAGRAHETTDLDRVAQTYAAWKADIAAGKSSLMMAKSNDTVSQLNALARQDLLESGAVSGVDVGLRDGHRAAVGDTVLSRKNDTTILIDTRGNNALNGQLWNVREVNGDGSLQVQLVGGKAVATLPARYVTEHVELGYASTIDRAKGMTVDTGHAVVDPSMSREDLYVALTRGREANHVYIPTESHLDVDTEHPAEAPTTAREVLVDIVGREGAEVSATEVMRDEMDAPGRLDRLAPEYADTVERVTKTAVVARSEHGLRPMAPPLPWLPPVPQIPADELVVNARGRAQGIADRAAELGDRVDAERPSWARPLGARPADPVPARDWDRAATFAAAYREQFGIDDDDQVLGERVDTGTSRGKAWQSADDAVRTVCPRRFSEVSDRKLAAKIGGWQRIQKDAASAKKDLEKIRTTPGTFITKAERDNAADRAAAEYARSVQAVRVMREEVKREAQVLRDREAELAGTGRFAGGKRKALGGEIAALKAAQEARVSSLTDAEANLGPAVPQVFLDSSDAEVEARCQQRLAMAQARDAKTTAGAVAHAERTAAAAAASRDALSEALDEQAYRERNGIEVADDPAVLQREQAQREQAQQQQRQQEMERSARMNETMAVAQVEGFGIG